MRRGRGRGVGAEVDRRDIDLAGVQAHRLLEIVFVADPAQLRVRDHACGAVRARPVDAHDLARAALGADEAERRIGRLGLDDGEKAACDSAAPDIDGHAVGVDPAGAGGTDQGEEAGSIVEARDVGAGAGDIGFDFSGHQPCVGLDAVEHPWRHHPLQAAIAEPADREGCSRNQQDHRDGQARGQCHSGNGTAVPCRRATGWQRQGCFGVRCQLLHCHSERIMTPVVPRPQGSLRPSPTGLPV